MSDSDDDLAEVLGPRPGPASVELREQLLRQTVARLNRGRWIRRGGRIAAIAGVFAFGGAMGWSLHASPRPNTVPEPECVLVAVPVVVPVAVPLETPSSSSDQVAVQLPGDKIEMQAELEDDLKAAAALYKSAGDAFLREEDYANAARCYRLFLDRAGDKALSLKPDDSWLLISLKNASFLEKAHVRKTGS